jgi:hypothetical protein
MSLYIAEDFSRRSEHPVDVVEQLAGKNGWSFDRGGDDEITITVGGGRSDYHVSFTWLDEVESLHLACAFDVKLNDRRRPEMLKLITLINEQMWIGHFGIWDMESMVIFRHAMLLSGGAQPTAPPCEAILQAAIGACERYYQSFHFVLWAGKTAQEALEFALFETRGEA